VLGDIRSRRHPAPSATIEYTDATGRRSAGGEQGAAAARTCLRFGIAALHVDDDHHLYTGEVRSSRVHQESKR
jgi:hypothetical protein